MMVRTNIPTAPPPDKPGKASLTPDTPLARATEKKRFAEHVARAEARPMPTVRQPGGRADGGKLPDVAVGFGRPSSPNPAKSLVQDRATATDERMTHQQTLLGENGLFRSAEAPMSEDDSDTAPGMAGPTVTERLGQVATVVVQAATVEAPDTSQFDRMAAAIAEVAVGGAQARYSVAFPPGLVAAGAVIAQDAAGALILRIVGVDAVVAAQMGERLRTDLAQALARRRVKVSRIDLESPHRRPATINARGAVSR